MSPELNGGPQLHSIGRTAAWLAKQVELGICDVDLSLPQYRVLGLLDEGSAVSSALAERLAVRPPSVTSVIDGLVARGLVARRPVVDDRRRISLVLTEEGRRSLAAADVAASCRLHMIAESLPTQGQAAAAISNLELWRQAIVDHHVAKAEVR